MSTPLRTIQDLIRQRISMGTPGFAGGTLEEQIRRSQMQFPPTISPSYMRNDPAQGSPDPRVMVLPSSGEVVVGKGGRIEGFGDERDYAPLASPPRLPSPAASPITNEPPIPEIQPPPYGPTMRDFRTGEPHREYYQRGIKSPYDERRAYMGALQDWQPKGGRGLKDILKATALSALAGMGATPDNPLAGAAGGALFGATGQLVDPRLGGYLTKNLKLKREQGLLDQQMESDLRQATLDRMRAQTEEAQAGLIPDPERPGRMMPRPVQRAPHYIERSDGVYEVSSAYPEGRKVGNIPAEARSASRRATHFFERPDGVYGAYEDVDGIKTFKLEGIPGKPASDAQEAQAAEGEAIATSTTEAANALKTELDSHKGQLQENERAIRAKDTWLKRRTAEILASDPQLKAQALISPSEARKAAEEKAKAEDKDVQSGVYDELLTNTDALRDAIKSKQKRYDDMQEEIRRGRAKGARGGGRTSATKRYAGRSMTRANLERYAKDKNITLEEAQRFWEGQGVSIR